MLISLTVSFAPHPAIAQTPLTPDQVLEWHRRYVVDGAEALKRDADSGDSERYYFVSIALMGMLSAVEITGSEADLMRVMRTIDTMMGHTVPSHVVVENRMETRRVWGPLEGDEPNELYNYQGAEPIARAAMVIMKRPAFKARYESRATAYADFVDELVFRRWWQDAYHGEPEWLTGDPPSWRDGGQFNDKSWLLGDIANSLYEATERPEYGQISDRIANGFRTFLTPAGTGWIWNNGTLPLGSDTNDEPGSVGNLAGVPDTDHTNRVPVMMIHQFRAGTGVWNLGDVERLCNTLGDRMWNQSAAEPIISNYINGSTKAYRTHFKAGENGFIFSGWALCAAYSPKARRATEAVFQGILNGAATPTVKENSDDYYKTIALTGYLYNALQRGRR